MMMSMLAMVSLNIWSDIWICFAYAYNNNYEYYNTFLFSPGRINLVDLQQALNVDLSHIEAKANDMVKHDRNLTLILGQLIDRYSGPAMIPY
jgi:hypothetical protein